MYNLFQDASNDDNLDACLSKNSKSLGQCILDCNNDTSCEADCVATFKDKHSECPCQVFQKTWTHFFQHFVQDKCPLGCPCENYECDLPDKKAILTLYSRSSSTQPVLIQPNGERLQEPFKLSSEQATFSINIIFKVVSLKTLSFKWMKIQKFTTLARRL